MQKRWHAELQEHLLLLAQQSSARQLRTVQLRGPIVEHDGQTLVNLSGNDYLGLSNHPALKQAAVTATTTWGVGSGASRLVSGHLPPHERAEQTFAAFKHAPAALLFPTGFMANMGVLTTLAGPGDLICADKFNHASLHDAARASGAELRVFPHRDLAKLSRLLQRRTSRTDARNHRRFIVTDSVFSMDGTVADLPAICDIADEYDAIVIVDEAHGTGLIGPTGAGLCELQNVSERVDVAISTASKALGTLGGLVTAAKPVVETLINRARPFIYTTSVPPAQAASIEAAVGVVQSEPWRRQKLADLTQRLCERLAHAGIIEARTAPWIPIIPIIAGESAAALTLEAMLRQHGFFAPAIRPPTVAPGSARVRITLRADLDEAAVDTLADVLCNWHEKRS